MCETLPIYWLGFAPLPPFLAYRKQRRTANWTNGYRTLLVCRSGGVSPLWGMEGLEPCFSFLRADEWFTCKVVVQKWSAASSALYGEGNAIAVSSAWPYPARIWVLKHLHLCYRSLWNLAVEKLGAKQTVVLLSSDNHCRRKICSIHLGAYWGTCPPLGQHRNSLNEEPDSLLLEAGSGWSSWVYGAV